MRWRYQCHHHLHRQRHFEASQKAIHRLSSEVYSKASYLEELPELKAVDTTRASSAEIVALLVDGPPEVDPVVDAVVTFAGAFGLIAVNWVFVGVLSTKLPKKDTKFPERPSLTSGNL